MIKKSLSTVLSGAVVVAGMSLSACAPANTQQGQLTGGLAGSLAGAAIGSRFGDGQGRTAAVIGGALLGGLIGQQIGSKLAPVDRQRHEHATYQALNTVPAHQPVQWQNQQTGAHGSIIPISNGYARPEYNGAICREYEQRITIPSVAGPQIERGMACRNPDGTWTRVK